MTADRNSDKTGIILLFLLPQSREWGDGGKWTHNAKVTIFLNSPYFLLGYIEEKGCNFWSFESIFMKSHTMIEKTLSEHIIMVILHFWVKNVVFEQKLFHLSKLPDFNRINSNGFRKHSLKIWAWSDNFSRFHRYWKFKIQRNKSEWCKTFFEEYRCHPTSVQL